MGLLITKTTRPAYRMAGILALASAVCSACAQPDVSSVVTAMSDPATPAEDLDGLSAQLETFDRSEVVAALTDIVETGSGAVRSEAIAWLASERDQTAASLSALTNAATTGDDHTQRTILARLQGSFLETEARAIARDLLDHFIAAGAVPAAGEGRATSVDMAALALVGSGDPTDQARLLQVLSLDQSSPGLWLAVSDFGALPAGELATAQALYANATNSSRLRVASAIAAGVSDSAAKTFAINEIQASIAAASNAGDWTTLVTSAYSGDQAAKATLQELRSTHAPLITMAPFLGGEDGEALLKSAFAVSIPIVADSAGYSAARRVPDAVIEEGPARFPADRLTQLLAVVVVHHPDRESQATPLAPDTAALDAARTAYSESGSAALHPLAPISFDGL